MGTIDNIEHTATRSAPLSSGEPIYWFASARIRREGSRILSAELSLKACDEEPRRLENIEAKLIAGDFADADQIMDEVRDLLECDDDQYGSAAAKSYLAGWVCADVVGRCLK